MADNVVRLAGQNQMDKQKALEAALSQIDRAFGKGSVMKLGQRDNAVDIEAVPTGSLGLDIALGIGGLPKGRVIEIYGPESSGKTTLALHVAAEAQRKGGICAFVDAEHALDPSYARKLGVDVDARRTGRRDGRHPRRPAGPADEPGPAQADRLDLQVPLHGHLH
jgi:recombination protein RecA